MKEMKDQNLFLQNIFKNDLKDDKDRDIELFALESYAKQVDNKIQNELLTRLVLDHSAITRELEVLYKELSLRDEQLVEAQKIAMLGRWDIYRETNEMSWSNSMYDIIGVDFSIPPSSNLFLSRVHPDDRDSVKLLLDEMFDKKEPWTTKYRLLMEDGRIKWIHLRFNSTLANQGNIIHHYGTIQDITEMKKAEDELKRYSEHLEELVEEKVKEISESQMATIYALIKLSESRDNDTGKHIERTASFCRLLAEKAVLSSKYGNEIDMNFLDTIYKASPLHDIGKVGIPDKILLKPGKLTHDEFVIMKSHVQVGYETIAKVQQQYDGNDFLKMGMEIALYHHEKWDGSGYLQGLSGEEIPLSARIMALADVYDALRSKRVYKEAFSHDKSLEIIKEGRGRHFDPVLVDVFVENHQDFKDLYKVSS